LKFFFKIISKPVFAKATAWRGPPSLKLRRGEEGGKMMIVKTLSGPLAGEMCQQFGGECATEFIVEMFLLHGDDWALDFSQATPEEALDWSLSNIVCKAMLAEQLERPMFFNGRKFFGYEEFLDEISSSDGLVIACQDDEEGFGVKTAAFPRGRKK